MKLDWRRPRIAFLAVPGVLALALQAGNASGASSYMSVIEEPFSVVLQRMQAQKPAIERRQLALLAERYDLGDHPASGVTMSRGKPEARTPFQ